MASSWSQINTFANINNLKTFSIIVGTVVQDAIETYLTNITNYWNGQLNYDIDQYNKSTNDDDRTKWSLQFNKDQTQMQAAVQMTNSTAQKATSFVSTLQADQQSTITSMSYIMKMCENLISITKSPL